MKPTFSNATTRDKLIAAAFTVVARDGLEAASVKSIAAEAGVGAGLLHYHFPTKEALLEAALRAALDQYLAAIRERRASLTGAALVDAMFADGRTALTEDADSFRLRLAFAAKALSDPALASTMRELNTAAVTENAVTMATARGETTATIRDHALAATLNACFDGLMLNALLDPTFPVDTAADLLRRGLQGMLAPNAP